MKYIIEIEIIDNVKNAIEVRTGTAVLRHGSFGKEILNIVERDFHIDTHDQSILENLGEIVSCGVMIWENN